ncbi:hypothetical protein MtrunA17_Chr1g0177031 [Medicago truncatula]|uniref:Uncharacterized protein n=1 Tax=Medicago truncatula TaxID=3880 RepID=A0A396JXJ4_MEDTR|nr:hypothetical protein MtrunA17_Chr1g0177031 [Medicago truncatula]
MMSYPLNSLQLHSIFATKPILLQYYSPIPLDSYDTFVASCDGLLSIAINNHLAVLYNPSIRKLKKLPSLDIPPHKYGYTTYAFGYNTFIDNYKVDPGFPSMIPNGESGITVSCTVNWFASSNASGSLSCAIVSLDLGKECYQEILEPNYDGMPVSFTLGIRN